jgi:hypothetical protein
MPDRSRVMTPDKKGYSGPPGWGFGVGLTTSHTEKLIVTKVEQRKRKDIVRQAKATAGCSANGRRRRRILRRRRRRRT